MSIVRFILLCLLFAAPGVRAAEQPWGDPVEGIQLRLTLAPAAQSAAFSALPVDLPLLQVEVRNQGTQSIKYSYADLAGSRIEIDGVTYWHAMATNGLSMSNSELKPGAQAAPTPLSELRLNGLHASGDNREFLPTPGPHTVRLTSTVGQFGDRRLQSPERTVTLSSNQLSVVVPAVDPAVERQALIDESVRGGVAYLPFRTLLRKYPDAALATVQRMLLQEPDSPMTDANLIAWLHDIQGEDVNAFLRARLGPDTHPASRSAAIWILFRRGDPLALPAAISAWRALQTSALSAAVLPDRSARLESRTGIASAAGGLITILANSTNVAAIDALARDLRQMPLEVRLSAVGVFLRPETGYINVNLNGGPASLPDGAAGLAIERLLFASLADLERIPRSVGSGNLQDYPEPRVADLAALVFATRWPARYSFNWDPEVSKRDARIEAIRKAWQATHPGNDRVQ